jgi:hypothetical protein
MMIIKGIEFMGIDDYHYENTYKKLCPSDGGLKKDEVLFEKYAQLFVYSCILGFIEDGLEPINKRANQVRWERVDSNAQARLIALSVAKHGSVEIMKDAEMLKNDLEQRSNYGMKIINRKMTIDNVDFRSFNSLLNELIGNYPDSFKS